MPIVSGKNELWRRLALLLGTIIGLALIFYITPALVSITAVDWKQEQVNELNSFSGYVTEEEKRLNQLPLTEYIKEKTAGQVVELDSSEWMEFFFQVQKVSNGHYDGSIYGDRVSDQAKESFATSNSKLDVFFQPDEIPLESWGLNPQNRNSIYITTNILDPFNYLFLRYQNYNTSVSSSYAPSTVSPDWLYHPYRLFGMVVLIVGLLIYLILPRRKNKKEDIVYDTGSLVAGDFVFFTLFLPFFGLPFLINGGTIQVFTGLWPVTILMWSMAAMAVLILYYNAHYAFYRIEVNPDALHFISMRGVLICPFRDIAEVNVVTLKNPSWFQKLFTGLAVLSLISGSRSLQPAGSARLASSAAYDGLEIYGCGEKPIYIWYTNQSGGIILKNFHKVSESLEAAGFKINPKPREVESLSLFM